VTATRSNFNIQQHAQTVLWGFQEASYCSPLGYATVQSGRTVLLQNRAKWVALGRGKGHSQPWGPDEWMGIAGAERGKSPRAGARKRKIAPSQGTRGRVTKGRSQGHCMATLTQKTTIW
jgi:hypothetical protein